LRTDHGRGVSAAPACPTNKKLNTKIQADNYSNKFIFVYMSFKGRILLTALASFFATLHTFAQNRYNQTTYRTRWVDSVYNQLSQEERIGQLFMVQVFSGRGYNEERITNLLTAHHVGGIIFSTGGPIRQAVLTNRFQQMAQVPLLIGMDAEWGVAMRLDSVKPFPRAMMLSATNDTAFAYKMGAAIANQCKRLGMHINFAPDIDVNNNPANPVINSRSFGEDKTRVARMGISYMRGMQNNNIIACAKHFPGHGNTSVDSHKDLPLIPITMEQLDTLELFPFRRLINTGVKSVMVAHLSVPAIDTTPHVPTSLSKNAITGLLRGRLRFNGLVITDALNMAGVTKYFPSGDASLMAFAAGNDLLLMPEDVEAGITKIKGAIDSGIIPQSRLDESVKKILGAKFDAGLANWKEIDTENITNDLNKQVDILRSQIAKAAITVVQDGNQVLTRINENMRIGYVGINASATTPLYETLQDRFANVGAAWLPKGSPLDTALKFLDNLSKYSLNIVAIHNLSFTPSGNYGLSDEAIGFLQQAGCRNNVMVVLMGNAYAMQYFCGAASMMVAYEDDSLTEFAVADVLLKKSKAKGKLPVTACLKGQSVCPAPAKVISIVKEPTNELRKVFFPSDAGVTDQSALTKLDQFIARSIADGVTPGCRVLAAKDGRVFYDKAFGHMKYDKKQPVDTNTLYDVASCTKALATTIAIMRLYEQGKLDLEKTLGYYLPPARGTNKENLLVKDILLHQAGLRSYIPFFAQTVDDNGKPKSRYYRSSPGEGFNTLVARGLYMRNDYVDSIWERIYTSPIENRGKMVYSDLDFFILAAIVQQISGKRIDKYVEDEFYRPMGLRRILYNPLSRFDTSDIAPTEIDIGFRNILLTGTVHDPGAAMMGGVAGHAGLFATAHDVAAVFQMLLNKGLYGSKRYFKAQTVDYFTAYHSPISHRGLGFDKPAPEEDAGPAGDRTTGLAFGHQGFTGTCVWADPGTGVVFVFLSNRVYPTSANTKLARLGVRTIAQDYIYEALGLPVNHTREFTYKTQVGK
jgi:beta-glucosidase-like glycosyl hydrolase/CubicO group peptidase (beta-lactamase class C family)